MKPTKKAIRAGTVVSPRTRRSGSTAAVNEVTSYQQAGLKLAAMLLHLHDMMNAHQQAAVSKPHVRGMGDTSLTRFTVDGVLECYYIALDRVAAR